ncbi:DUF6774 domain-containing protein [Anaerocolumna sp. MB42-C2]|uniref:DUF6774 domain-containing protein n=1 Tax=Anaerocolumna sp. MB42-C2 TaxID=3070997 RepID=UPI0027E0DA8F|nr:DUF6774 domain-containing protein [Anaerocolumna sp. MB42-C2]WMJ89335.1 hypothetical protein RBU59_07365 [Anaerocolumna sp. MB42-C2]
MSPEELAALATSLAIAIAKDKTTDEIDLIAILLAQIGTTLGTISLQRERLKPKSESGTTPPVPPIIL